MRFSVRHETLYRYSAPVLLAPHILRLTPRGDGADILRCSLHLEPPPAERRVQSDPFGNVVTRVSFAGVSGLLRIESGFDLDTVVPAPLHDPGLPSLPWRANPQDGLAEYRRDSAPDPAVQDFASALVSQSAGSALAFLDQLTQALFRRMDRHIRVEGAAQSPAVTLATGRGACRDITVLFMAACRSLGFAARFVSGYQAKADAPDGARHMHAWPEVFLPGLGWRGFDPTHGVTVSDGHVALCAAPAQDATMPVEGGFYGVGVTATLDYQVQIATA